MKRIALISTLFALGFSWPLLLNLNVAGLSGDWNYNIERCWAAWYSVTRLHRFPWTQQWICGGYPLFTYPNFHFSPPFFPMQLLFGVATGLHLEVVVHIAIGFAGGWFLARVLEISPLGAFGCALTFMGSSWYYLHLSVGHLEFMSYAYVPWVLGLFWLGAKGGDSNRSRSSGSDSARYAQFDESQNWPLDNAAPAGMTILAGALLALIIFEGGVVDVLPHTMLLLGVLAVFLSVGRLSLWPLVTLLGVTLVAMALSAIKWIPMELIFRDFVRAVPDNESNRLTWMVRFIFSRDQAMDNFRNVTPFGPWEYGAYISPILAGLALIGAASRRAIPWLLLAALLFVTAMGSFGVFAPWRLLHRLPVWYEIRLPSRFLILFTLCVGVLVGFGVDRIRDEHKTLAALLLCAVMVDCWLIGPPMLNVALTFPAKELSPAIFDLNYVRQIPCEAIHR